MRVINYIGRDDPKIDIPQSFINLINIKAPVSTEYQDAVSKSGGQLEVINTAIGSLIREQLRDFEAASQAYSNTVATVINKLNKMRVIANRAKDNATAISISLAVSQLTSAVDSGDNKKLDSALDTIGKFINANSIRAARSDLNVALSNLKSAVGSYQGLARLREQYLVNTALAVANLSLALCPIKTGRLATSLTVEIMDRGFTITYAAPYALYVHENMAIKHPNHISRGYEYSCGGEAKFLEKAWTRRISDSSPILLSFGKGTVAVVGKLDLSSEQPRVIPASSRKEIL